MKKPDKSVVPYNVVQARMARLQVEWSLDKLLKQLQSRGIDIALRVIRTKVNEVNITITTDLSKRAKGKLDEVLFKLYGIIP